MARLSPHAAAYPACMTSRGGTPSHTYEVAATLQRYFWMCSCGSATSAVYETENAAVASAERRVGMTPPAQPA